MNDSRPLVLLDVDGVLNLGQFMPARERGHLHRRDGWYSGRAGDRHDPYASRIVLNRAWGPMLRTLEEAGAELAWATGWQYQANAFISPLLGLGQLPWSPCIHGSKAETVVPWTQGRPWAWFEDYASELAAASALTAPGVPHCPVLVDRATGLTADHVSVVARWLDSL